MFAKEDHTTPAERNVSNIIFIYLYHLPKTNSAFPTFGVMAPKMSFSFSTTLAGNMDMLPTNSVWENKLVYHVVNSLRTYYFYPEPKDHTNFWETCLPERHVHFPSQSSAEQEQQFWGL